LTNRGLEREVENVNTGKRYTSIQEAIDATDTLNGHTLLVHPGKYVESVNVTKTLTLKGLNRSSTIIEKGRNGLAAVTVRADSSTIANFTVGNSTIGIQCFNTIGCRILSNGIANCNTSIEAYFSNDTLIEGNEVFNGSLRGIHIYNSSYTIVLNNTIENISEVGKAISAIHIQHSRNNTIVQNQLLRNACGIQLEADASNNTAYHNNFINNTKHALVYSVNNTWDNGYPSGGNYWSGRNFRDICNGPDQNIPGSDGIQDFLYIIDEYNFDRYPFVSPLNITIRTCYDE
jgi:parallel beta-helix repeat protein